MRLHAQILIFLFASTFSLAQTTKIDSLRKLLAVKKDTAAVNNLCNIAKEFNAINQDSFFHYTNKAVKKADEIGYQKGKARAMILEAGYYRRKGSVDTAMMMYKSIVDLSDKNSLNQESGEAEMLIGFMLQNQGEYDQSIIHLINAEKKIERSGNKLLIGRCNWMLGNTYLKLKSREEAIKSFEKGKSCFGQLNDSLGYFDCVLNTAIVYLESNEFDKALPLISASEKYYRKVNHAGALSASLVNKSKVLTGLNRTGEAEMVLKEALELKKILGAPLGIANCLLNLGSLYQMKKDYVMAESSYLDAIAIGRKDHSLEVILNSYEGLYSVFKEKGNAVQALHYHEKYMELNDSIYNSEKNKIIEEMKTKFETEKKDNELLKKDGEIARQEAESKQKSLQRNALIVGFILMLMFATFIFKSLQQNKKANKIITEQKNLVEEKQKEILDSIKYAERIQKALVTNEKYIHKNLTRLNKS